LDILYDKTWLCGKYYVIGCAYVIVLSFFLPYFKVERCPGTWVIATEYPVP